jgi:site-specific recombinase XerD
MKNSPQLMQVVREISLTFCLHRHQENHLRYTVRDLEAIAGIKSVKDYTPIDISRLLHYWLEKGATVDTLARKFRFCKRIFRYAQEMGYIKKNPCYTVPLPKAKVKQIVALTNQELAAIENCTVHKLTLKKVKDFFLFQCYTGLAYCDVCRFTVNDIHMFKGKQYIVLPRAKTNTMSIVPLSEKAIAILRKHNNTIPILCNQRVNRFLKQLAQAAGVEKNLTTHTGRKTFAQLNLEAGISIDTVSRMLGHTSVAITQRHYADSNIYSVHREFERLSA